METDVTGSLAELERKLKELERELEAAGNLPEPSASSPAGSALDGRVVAWHGRQAPPSTPVAPAPPAASDRPASAPPPSAADREAAKAGARAELEELMRLRERLTRTADELVAEAARVVGILAADGVGGGREAHDPAQTLLSGRVTVEVAPFPDVATLGAFERALQGAGGVLDARVRTFADGHATFEVELSGPTALASELRRSWTAPLRVVEVGPGRLELALDAEPEP